EGRHPTLGFPLLHGHRERVVKALDLTLSAPKSLSLLWAFADPVTAAEVSIAVTAAATTALDFLEAQAAVTRRQVGGVRRQVPTRGFAAAMFTHWTSRAGDPQLHVHCLVPNIVERDDGTHVAIDAGPIHTWLKAAGTVFQADLQRRLIERLGVTWGPERNGTRELAGFNREQLRAFSKRTVAIETLLEAGPEAVTPRERMRADDRASLATRQRKDPSFTPAVLRERWTDEAARAGIPTGPQLLRTLRHEPTPPAHVDPSQLFDELVDPNAGLCATRARFGHAHVVERVAALSAGRWTTTEIEAAARQFLASPLVVRLAPGTDDAGRRRPPQWSTLEHRQLEDRVLDDLATLRHDTTPGAAHAAVAVGLDPRLGEDQRTAVHALCGPGARLRVVLAAAGHGKTALTTNAVDITRAQGRQVVALAATNKAVAELRAAGVDARTIARWRLDAEPLPAGAVVVLDEVSQVSTRDAAAVLAAVTATPDAVLWCLGDEDQGRSVAPGGLAAELARLADAGEVTAAELYVNHRQIDPAERDALTSYRQGDLAGSQATRTKHGWEHTLPTPATSRDALAAALAADIERHGRAEAVALAVSHADCEDLADRLRTHLRTTGALTGPELTGPGWSDRDRAYAAGDRILFHTTRVLDGARVHNGTTATITTVTRTAMLARIDDGPTVTLPAAFVAGRRPDGTPNLSHAWSRTIDGAQGGTWAQVHLLATPSVDRHTLYVGQSRGRLPTHTWNTTIETGIEAHGNVVTDRRPPEEIILAAAGRRPDTTFAAHDDPHVRDRQLRAARAEHERALASGPSDVYDQRNRTRRRVEDLEHDVDAAARRADGLHDRMEAVGGLRQLRRSNRWDRRQLVPSYDAAVARYDELTTQLDAARADLARLDAMVRKRAAWEQANRWRQDEIAGIDHQLGLHWTQTVLAAIGDGVPTAHGLDRLRDVRRFLAATPESQRPLAVVENALRDERVERLLDIDADWPVPEHLIGLLGPLPPGGAVRDVWLALAERAEARLDHGQPLGRTGPFASYDAAHSADPLDHARTLIAIAARDEALPATGGPEQWRQALDVAIATRDAIEQRVRLDRENLGLSL
nr:relaxase domain-containing protein [Actinomycetota bacterium]